MPFFKKVFPMLNYKHPLASFMRKARRFDSII